MTLPTTSTFDGADKPVGRAVEDADVLEDDGRGLRILGMGILRSGTGQGEYGNRNNSESGSHAFPFS